MAVEEDTNGSPKIPDNPSRKRREVIANGQKNEDLFSPNFRSVAAMAGWDEEALLIASLIVEDTPDRLCKQRKRLDLHGVKSPPTNSRRKRTAQRRRSAASIPVTILDLDEEEPKSRQESKKTNKEDKSIVEEVKKKQRVEIEVDDEGLHSKKSSDVSSSTPSIPCLDRLREELSCAVCLDICYEPSTTPCGHSFCKKCLSSAADKCGRKCPKCRQIISNGRYCKVNTVLWNTIQLLFPKEVEARKAAAAAESQEAEPRAPTTSSHHQITRSRALDDLRSLGEAMERRRSRDQRLRRLRPASRGLTREEVERQQDRDAEMALRLQREEFSEAFLGPDVDGNRSSLTSATANLRAMASRAINIRIGRGQRD